MILYNHSSPGRTLFDSSVLAFDGWQPFIPVLRYLCRMKYDFIKNYDKFVILVWIFYWGIMVSQQLVVEDDIYTLSTVEVMLVYACILGVAYPFTTYLSKQLLKKAMEKRNMLKFIVQFFFITAIFTVVTIPIFVLFDYLERIGIFPRSEWMELWKTWSEVGFDYLNTFFIALVLNFSFCGLRFFEQNLKLQNELGDSRFQILQAQINPHFMFNVLNHIHVLINKEPELADSLLLQYTDVLRYQLYSGKKEYINIEQEIRFLRNFIDIEKVRWKNKLDIQCSWKIEDNSLQLPPLLFITFIENAFKHVSRSNTEKGYVNINFEQKNNRIELDVQNSKSSIKVKKKDDSGIGLENIKRRLDILFPGKYSLVIDNTDTDYSVRLIINI